MTTREDLRRAIEREHRAMIDDTDSRARAIERILAVADLYAESRAGSASAAMLAEVATQRAVDLVATGVSQEDALAMSVPPDAAAAPARRTPARGQPRGRRTAK